MHGKQNIKFVFGALISCDNGFLCLSQNMLRFNVI